MTSHVFARVDGKLARWDLSYPEPVDTAIAMVTEAANPPKPVLALVIGGPAKEKANADQS